ncbi:unnamed protein product [Malus baccata var. baccata]
MAAATLLPSTPFHCTNPPLPHPRPNSLFFSSFSNPSARHQFPPPTSADHVSPFPFHPGRPSVSLYSRPGRCLAAQSGPPLPPPDSDSTSLAGLAASFSKFQDKVQIFFAVLFWMSLFFWASVWDERSRPDKGSRFRK